MSYQTLRKKNYCLSCDYEWYPRGKHRSSKCPNCGNRDVRMRNVYIVYDVPTRKKCVAIMQIATYVLALGLGFKNPIVSSLSLTAIAGGAAVYALSKERVARYE